eukprot:93352-Rhodomonas_salina.1
MPTLSLVRRRTHTEPQPLTVVHFHNDPVLDLCRVDGVVEDEHGALLVPLQVMAQRLAHGGHDVVALHGVRVDHRRVGQQLQRLCSVMLLRALLHAFCSHHVFSHSKALPSVASSPMSSIML